MKSSSDFSIQRVLSADIALMESLTGVFGDAFEDIDTYSGNRPDADYLAELLDGDYFIALCAIKNGDVIGGIAAYELRKFEQARSEIYLYDLAVALPYRRLGVATALVEALKDVARERGAYVVFVQADADDDPAISLYNKLGSRAEVLHFDMSIDTGGG